jgi:hypothetical protein
MASKDSWPRVSEKLQANLRKAWRDTKADTAREKASAVAIAAKLAAAREARRVECLITACASHELWFRFVHPKGAESMFAFLDPRWWQPNLRGLLIQGGEGQQTFLEITETELANFFMNVDHLLAWLTKRGWVANRGAIKWNYLTGDFISKSWLSDAGNPVNPEEGETRHDGSDGSQMAPPAIIDTEISDAYSTAERSRQKPPNVKEIAKVVQDRLRTKGYQASLAQIQELADAEKHKRRRRKPGATVASENRRMLG